MDDIAPLGRSIGRTHKFVRAWGDRTLAPLGATITDYIVLTHIGSAPEPGLSQTEVARYSDMGGPALVRYIDRMEQEGLVTRTRDAADRRIQRVTLTPAGEARQAELQAVVTNGDQQLRSLLTEEEATVMQRALDRIFEHLLGELFATPTSPTTRSN
jgi:MarR family transcriptional regulator for hemolysin